MARLYFKNTNCFDLGRKFGQFFAETETESLVGHYLKYIACYYEMISNKKWKQQLNKQFQEIVDYDKRRQNDKFKVIHVSYESLIVKEEKSILLKCGKNSQEVCALKSICA